jgi:hypothetical protein
MNNNNDQTGRKELSNAIQVMGRWITVKILSVIGSGKHMETACVCTCCIMLLIDLPQPANEWNERGKDAHAHSELNTQQQAAIIITASEN